MSDTINTGKGVAQPKREIPETTKSKAEIEDLMIRARVKMLLNKSAVFFGSLATRLIFKDATDWCPTAGTDGRYFYYNRNFIAALSASELEFLMGHEVLHCVYDHITNNRRGNRNPMLFNVAADYVINNDLVEAGIGERITLVDICYDRKYAGWTTEEVYDDLYEDIKQQGGDPEDSDGNGQGTLDVHMDGQGGGEDDQGDSDAPGEGNNDGSQGPVRYSEKERERIRQDVTDAVKSAAKQAAMSGGAGNLPGGVRRLVNDLLDPKMDWRELLSMQIQSVIKSNYNWNIPSRKGMDAGIYMPAMDREQMIDIAIAIDTSGSIGEDMLRDFLSEVNGIISQYASYKIKLWCFDTEIHNPQEFTSENGEDILDYEIGGWGGTDFDVNFEFMKENAIEPKKFIMFTDGYPFGSWGDENYCDTLFIIHGGRHGDVPEAPFGLTVPYTSLSD